MEEKNEIYKIASGFATSDSLQYPHALNVVENTIGMYSKVDNSQHNGGSDPYVLYHKEVGTSAVVHSVNPVIQNYSGNASGQVVKDLEWFLNEEARKYFYGDGRKYTSFEELKEHGDKFDIKKIYKEGELAWHKHQLEVREAQIIQWGHYNNKRYMEIEELTATISDQKKEIEALTKDYSDTQNWYGWLCARMPDLKQSHCSFWIKQALQGYADDQNKKLTQENESRKK